jgi:TolB-like protein/DNA-binding winged helix-turn-helix (wHTH) protein
MAIQNDDHPPGSVSPEVSYRVGDLVVELPHERVTRDGREIPLPKLTFDLLAALVRAAPELVSIDSLMRTVWPRLVVGPETVVQRVKLLRAALGDDSKRPRYVAGVRGRGYRIVAPVDRVLGGLREGRVSSALPSQKEAPSWPARPRSFLGNKLAIAAVLAVLATGTALVAVTTTRRVAAPRVAVLPFENLSPDRADGFFVEGMHDEVISALAERAPSIDVIARTTMMTFRDRRLTAAHTVAAELGATYVIAGTVRRDDAHVRLTVQLIDPRTDSALWSRAYELADENVAGLRSEVAADLAAHLPVQTAAATRARASSTPRPEAYELYLKGLVARVAASGGYSRSWAAVRAVEEPLTQAIELDPAFADAYAERAVIRLGEIYYNLDTSDAQLERATKDVAAAERLAPAAPKTLAARAYYLLLGNDFDGALTKFRAAEAAGLADPMWMLDATTILTDRRSPADALHEVERVLAIDPRNPVAVQIYAVHLLAAHRSSDAVRAIDLGLAASPHDPSLAGLRALAIFGVTGLLDPSPETREPEDGVPSVRASIQSGPLARAFDLARWSGQIDELQQRLRATSSSLVPADAPGAGSEPIARYRAWANLLLGERSSAEAEGRSILEYLRETRETPRNRSSLRLLEADAYTFVGDSSRAIAAAREASRMPRGNDLLSQRDKAVAAIYAWNGDSGDALDVLERLATGTPGVSPAEIVRDPWYTMPLAHDPRFEALAARLEEQMRATLLR